MLYSAYLSRLVFVAMAMAASGYQAAQSATPEKATAATAGENATKLAELAQIENFYTKAMSKGAELVASAEYREAVKSYQKALSLAKRLSDQAKENEAREKAISAVRSLSVAPAIPEEAHRHGMRGEALMKSAKKPADFRRAVVEYEAATTIAPWWGSAYYNLGMVREGEKDAIGAIAAFNLFLKAEPDAPEARAIQDRIYTLEISAEGQAALIGMWRTKTGSVFKSEFLDGHFVLTTVKPNKVLIKRGYYPSLIAFKGQWDGAQVVGKLTLSHRQASARPELSECFGNFGAYSAIIKLTEPDKLTVYYKDKVIVDFNLETCEILKQPLLEFSFDYFRMQ